MALAYDDDISLLTLEGVERPDSQSPAKKAKIDSDKCLFMVGPEKKHITWDQTLPSRTFCLEQVRSNLTHRNLWNGRNIIPTLSS
jgi:hypothetical protein